MLNFINNLLLEIFNGGVVDNKQSGSSGPAGIAKTPMDSTDLMLAILAPIFLVTVISTVVFAIAYYIEKHKNKSLEDHLKSMMKNENNENEGE